MAVIYLSVIRWDLRPESWWIYGYDQGFRLSTARPRPSEHLHSFFSWTDVLKMMAD